MSSGHRPDYLILGLILFLLLAGFIFLSSASSDVGKIRFNDTYYFLKSQVLKGLIPGILGFLAGYFIYYRRWKKFAAILFLINIGLLMAVFTPLGYSSNGSTRWLNLGPLSFQPSELLKLTFVIYLASLFSSAQMKSSKKGWKTYWLFLFVCAIAGGLVLLQPATTMVVIVIGAGAIMYFYSGASWKQLAVTMLIGLVGIAGLALISPYRFNRLAPYWNAIAGKVNPSWQVTEVSSDRFHLNQSLIAIGTGGLTGVGFGKSTSKYSVLPEPMGDSIFAVIAEEFGFFGVLIIIGSYLVIFWKGTILVKRSHDDFAKLCILGFISVLAIQTIIHIAANTGLLPFTGVPLPLISYGGTSLAVTLTMFGIIGNISRHTSYS